MGQGTWPESLVRTLERYSITRAEVEAFQLHPTDAFVDLFETLVMPYRVLKQGRFNEEVQQFSLIWAATENEVRDELYKGRSPREDFMHEFYMTGGR